MEIAVHYIVRHLTVYNPANRFTVFGQFRRNIVVWTHACAVRLYNNRLSHPVSRATQFSQRSLPNS